MVIVFGVFIASYGEVKFVWLGFAYQSGGIFAEAMRLIMIQVLLSGEGRNAMDPLVSLYYYAPVCAVMNFLVALVTEWSMFEIAVVWKVGVFVLVANAAVAFMLNVASVMLVSIISGSFLFPNTKRLTISADRKDVRSRDDTMRCAKEYITRSGINGCVGYYRWWSSGLWFQHCVSWTGVL